MYLYEDVTIQVREVKRELRMIAFNHYHGFKPSKVFSSVFSKGDVAILKELAADISIDVPKPGKGRGVELCIRRIYDES